MLNKLFNIIQKRQIARLRRWQLILLLSIIILLLLLIFIYSFNIGDDEQIVYGITYSHKYAKELDLDWQDAFSKLVDDLGARHFRIMAYWDSVEPVNNQFDFSELDWLLRRAQYSGAKVIVVVGRRQPRWPECHQPVWVDKLTLLKQQEEELEMIEVTVNHLKQHSNIIGWQVENEPFLSVFGECPIVTEGFYKKKLALVQSLDNRPTIITDSGELSTWVRSSRLNPILGTSIYRHVWNQYYGDFIYPMPPMYYYIKYKILKKFTPLEEVFVSELQQEPWVNKPILDTPLDEQYQSMNLDRFEKNIQYVKKVGFDKIYLWGAEWWLWMKIKQGDDSFWNQAKQLFKVQ